MVDGWPRRSTAGLEQFALLAAKVGDGRLKRRKRFLHAVKPIAQSVKALAQCRALRFRQASPIANAAKVCNVLRRTSDLTSQRLTGVAGAVVALPLPRKGAHERPIKVGASSTTAAVTGGARISEHRAIRRRCRRCLDRCRKPMRPPRWAPTRAR